MPIFRQLKSPLGYYLKNDQTDSYGVDHSNFTTRDELEYQFARDEREKNLMKQEELLGLTDNYTQYGTDFWGTSADNNYGFGPSDIAPRIEPKNWETAADGKKVYETVLEKEGYVQNEFQNPIDFLQSAFQGGTHMWSRNNELANQRMVDKFKHALINCEASQFGAGGDTVATLLSDLKELLDVHIKNSNTLDESNADQYANKIGRLIGRKYPNESCDSLLSDIIKKY